MQALVYIVVFSSFPNYFLPVFFSNGPLFSCFGWFSAKCMTLLNYRSFFFFFFVEEYQWILTYVEWLYTMVNLIWIWFWFLWIMFSFIKFFYYTCLWRILGFGWIVFLSLLLIWVVVVVVYDVSITFQWLGYFSRWKCLFLWVYDLTCSFGRWHLKRVLEMNLLCYESIRGLTLSYKL